MRKLLIYFLLCYGSMFWFKAGIWSDIFTNFTFPPIFAGIGALMSLIGAIMLMNPNK